MREGGKKTFKKKKTLNIFLEKGNKGDQTKKNIGQIPGKVNEGGKIKIILTKIKVNKADEKNKPIKNIAEKIFVIS